jgi:hypothetical protein
MMSFIESTFSHIDRFSRHAMFTRDCPASDTSGDDAL